MQLFKRIKVFPVYFPEIDQEHRTISQAADKLHQAILANVPRSEVLEMLRNVMGLAEDHFAHEEKLMRAYHYPMFEWHSAQHETVRKRVRQFISGIEADEPESALLLMEFLAGWMKDHTGLADRMMSAYVRNRRRIAAA
jgi:hemerythrin